MQLDLDALFPPLPGHHRPDTGAPRNAQAGAGKHRRVEFRQPDEMARAGFCLAALNRTGELTGTFGMAGHGQVDYVLAGPFGSSHGALDTGKIIALDIVIAHACKAGWRRRDAFAARASLRSEIALVPARRGPEDSRRLSRGRRGDAQSVRRCDRDHRDDGIEKGERLDRRLAGLGETFDLRQHERGIR